ncbi:MAG: glycoside hydrolase family 2 protein [Promethearchaeota archaeon]
MIEEYGELILSNEDHLLTRWAKKVNPEQPLPEFPRPQLMREDWINLNGFWDYLISSKKIRRIDSYDGKILVPFPIESILSGVKRKLKPNQILWYHKEFDIPLSWKNKNILIHFGAVDWEAEIQLNGKIIGNHKGGYTPFSFNITDYITFEKSNELIVKVSDPTDKKGIARGKQTLRPYGIKYTSVSGIWQTVWLEAVNKTYISKIKTIPDIDNSVLKLNLEIENVKRSDKIVIQVFDRNNQILEITSQPLKEININIEHVKLWNPENPHLYDLKIDIIREGEILDSIKSYFGMRKISLGKEKNGVRQILLNNEPIFQYGVLDQGYWPDGLYTPPTDEALRYDVEIIKKLGFNTVRKHVKVELARWYYYCDKLGLIVWQDMPNGGSMGFFKMMLGFLKRKKAYDHKRKEADKQQFLNELREMIEVLYNHPSIVMWVPFNEGWGQFETKKVVNYVKNLDPSRLVNEASGWFNHGSGDICDCHEYVGPAMPKNINNRAAVCGEFGGLGLKITGHMWKKKFKFVYKSFSNSKKLLEGYSKIINKLEKLKEQGLSAAIYTQLTDVEGEVNGLLTYDREIIKMDESELKKLNQSIIEN